MTLEERKKEFETIIKTRLSSFVLATHLANAADAVDLIEREGSTITATAEMYFSAQRSPRGQGGFKNETG